MDIRKHDNIILISFPRSGGNFLLDYIKSQSRIKISYQHHTDTSKKIIMSIVRDPIDSLASLITMQYFFGGKLLLTNKLEDVVTNFSIPHYLNLYNFLLSKDTIFINYKDFSDMDKLMPKLYNKLNIKNYSYDDDMDEPGGIDKGYLATSKNQENYEEVKNILKNINMDKCYDVYKKALDRCI